MDILNQKEDVLKVELTKHGRKLLGLGIFQPKYFAFYDDSIIYDNSYGGNTNEDVNKIQGRILDNTLTFTAPNLLVQSYESELGSSDTINDYAPAWDLGVLNGRIIPLLEESTYYRKKFNFVDIIYNISLAKDSLEPIIEEDYILIDLKELNVQDELNNFEIEIISYDKLTGGIEKKLLFHQNKTNIIDGILYEENELPYNFFNVDISINDVGYYLDVLVDDEIDTDFIIAAEGRAQKKPLEVTRNIYTSTEVPDPCDPCCDDPGTEQC